MSENRKLGDYDLIDTLSAGEGAFGLVHKGRHRHIPGDPVAIKELKKLGKDKEEEFFREIGALEVLLKRSPHLVVFKYASFDSRSKSFYCVMEWCEGGDLAQISEKNQGLSPGHLLLIGRQACLGLKAAHDVGFVHRDIKPKNLMLGEIEPDGYRKGEKKDIGVKIIDFGLVDLKDDSGSNGTDQFSQFHGTPLFASPEQVRNEEEPPDQRSDLYSLGISLWFLCLGRRPKVFEDNDNIFVAHVSPEPHDLSEIVDENLRGIVANLVQKERKDRYQNAEDAFHAFEIGLGHYLEDHGELSDLASLVTTSDASPTSVLEKSVDTVDQLRETSEERYTEMRGLGWGTSIGKAYQANVNGGEGVSLLLLDESLLTAELDIGLSEHLRSSVNWMVKSHLWAIGKEPNSYPDSLIRPRSLNWFSDGQTIVESEAVAGTTFRELMRLRGKQRFDDAVTLLAPVAKAIDYCANVNGGCGVVGLDPSQLFIEFASEVLPNDLSNLNLGDLPEFKVKASPFDSIPAWLIKRFAENMDDSMMETADVSMTMTDNSGGGTGPFAVRKPQLALFGSLLYQLIGGRAIGIAAYSTLGGYSNIGGLSEESNLVLGENISNKHSTFSCVDFLKTICELEGMDPGAVGPVPQYPVDEALRTAGAALSGILPNYPNASTKREDPSENKQEGSQSNYIRQLEHLAAAPSEGVGKFINPHDMKGKRIEMASHEIRFNQPYRVEVNGVEKPYVLDHEDFEPFTANVGDVRGTAITPYLESHDAQRVIDFTHPTLVDRWQEGHEVDCPVTGVPFKLPEKLPPLYFKTDEERPGIAISPYSDGGEMAIPPTGWKTGGVFSLKDRRLELPTNRPAPRLVEHCEPLGCKYVDPFTGAEIALPEKNWKPNEVVATPDGRLCVLPPDLPPPVHYAEILDGRKGIVLHPKTKNKHTVPGESWIGGAPVSLEKVETFYLPEGELPFLECEIISNKPGFVIDPHDGEEVKLRSDQWQEDRPIKRGERSFRLPTVLPTLSVALFEEKQFGWVYSPHAESGQVKVDVPKSDWKREKVIQCPETEFLFRLDPKLPEWMDRLDISGIASQGFRGTVRIPEADEFFCVDGAKWIENGIITYKDIAFLLPEKLPPLAATLVPEKPGTVLSPYGGKVRVDPTDWSPGNTVKDPKDSQGRSFKLPDATLPDLWAIVDPERPGEARSPFVSKSEKPMRLSPDDWVPEKELECSTSKRRFTLPVEAELPQPKNASWEDGNFDTVIDPFTKNPYSIDLSGWKEGKLFVSQKDKLLFRLPDDLPEQPKCAEVEPVQGKFKGQVLSPYGARLENEIDGKDWVPGKLFLCKETGTFFRLPKTDLPLLTGRFKEKQPLEIESPFDPGNFQKVDPSQWMDGQRFVCKTTGHAFLLPPNLPPAVAKIEENLPGLLIIPQTSEKIEIEEKEWVKNRVFEAKDGNLTFRYQLPADIPPIGDAKIRNDEKAFGKFTSPFAKSAEEFHLTEQEWITGGVIRCPKTRALIRLPEKRVPWLQTAQAESLRDGVIGAVKSPYEENIIELSGDEWIPGRKIPCDMSGRDFLLPDVLPPLTASAPDPAARTVVSPYTDQPVAILPKQWRPNQPIKCKESVGEFLLPTHLPPLIAGMVEGKPGFATTPYKKKSPKSKDELSFKVDHDVWGPNARIKCPASGELLQLPADADLPPMKVGELIKSADKSLGTERGKIKSPQNGQVQDVPMNRWIPGGKVRCEKTGALFLLPGLDDGLKPWAEECQLADTPGFVFSPYVSRDQQPKPFQVPGPKWKSRTLLDCPYTEGKQILLPNAVPPLTAMAISDQPGWIETPYVDPSEKNQCEVQPDEWEPGREITCPLTQRDLVLPEDLPLLVGIIDENHPGWVYSPFCKKTDPIKLGFEAWVANNPVICPETNRKFALPQSLPSPKQVKAFDAFGILVTSPYGKNPTFQCDEWAKGKVLTCPESGALFALPEDLPSPRGLLVDSIDDVVALASTEGTVKSPFGGHEEVTVRGPDWRVNAAVKDSQGREFLLPPKLPALQARPDREHPGRIFSPYVKKASSNRVPNLEDWEKGGVELACRKTDLKMVLPPASELEDVSVVEASWKREDRRKKLLFGSLAGTGVLVALVFLVVSLSPDAEKRWHNWLVATNQLVEQGDYLEAMKRVNEKFAKDLPAEKGAELEELAESVITGVYTTLKTSDKLVDEYGSDLSKLLEKGPYSDSDNKGAIVEKVAMVNLGERTIDELVKLHKKFEKAPFFKRDRMDIQAEITSRAQKLSSKNAVAEMRKEIKPLEAGTFLVSLNAEIASRENALSAEKAPVVVKKDPATPVVEKKESAYDKAEEPGADRDALAGAFKLAISEKDTELQERYRGRLFQKLLESKSSASELLKYFNEKKIEIDDQRIFMEQAGKYASFQTNQRIEFLKEGIELGSTKCLRGLAQTYLLEPPESQQTLFELAATIREWREDSNYPLKDRLRFLSHCAKNKDLATVKWLVDNSPTQAAQAEYAWFLYKHENPYADNRKDQWFKKALALEHPEATQLDESYATQIELAKIQPLIDQALAIKAVPNSKLPDLRDRMEKMQRAGELLRGLDQKNGDIRASLGLVNYEVYHTFQTAVGEVPLVRYEEEGLRMIRELGIRDVRTPVEIFNKLIVAAETYQHREAMVELAIIYIDKKRNNKVPPEIIITRDWGKSAKLLWDARPRNPLQRAQLITGKWKQVLRSVLRGRTSEPEQYQRLLSAFRQQEVNVDELFALSGISEGDVPNFRKDMSANLGHTVIDNNLQKAP